VLTTFVDGEVYFNREKDVEMRAAQATERKALIEKEKERAKKKNSGGGREANQPAEAVR
jgi:hypothetical protein